ncbi:MAG: hypothetical protein ABIJ95_07320 [Pseudomonadota bacterium]
MSAEPASPYQKAHLVAAAIRIIEHQKGVPPQAGEISGLLGFSVEEVHGLLNLMTKIGAVDMMESPAGPRPRITDPAPLENLPRERQRGVEKEMVKFAAQQKERMDKLSVAAANEKDRKKQLFAALEEQLKAKKKD